MGQYHYLINLDKKQFVHPHQIGNGLKLKEQVGWDYSTATVLVMLLAASSRDGGRGGGDFHAEYPLIGSWAGDRVAFVGDYAEAEDIPDCDARSIYEECTAIVSGEPATPSKSRKKGWTNISPLVREMMGAEFGIRYKGDGWLEIVEKSDRKNLSPLTPDLVVTRKT